MPSRFSGFPHVDRQHAPYPEPFTLSPEPFGDSVHVTLPEGTRPEQVITALASSGLTGAAITEIIPGIEDVFLELMKRTQ